MARTKRSELERLVRDKARAELKGRQQARIDPLAFTQYTMPAYEAGSHLQLLSHKLMQVERGEIDRLMVFMPPRHGKSELSSTRFPAWYLGRHPTRQIITASYSADLAENTFGRNVRNLFRSPEFSNVFPNILLSNDSSAKGQWATNKGGVYVAAGVDGGLTGKGAHLAIIDDPFKDRKEAESQVIRDNVWDWYRSVLYTRLMPSGAIVLIMTRWHPDDLAGRLLKAQDTGGDHWDVVELPALADSPDDALGRSEGEALWPDRYPLPALKRIRDTVGPREWAALYQQKPTEAEGNLFKLTALSYLDAEPSGVIDLVRRWDLAATRDTGGNDPDWTVGVKMGRLDSQHYVILDIVRFRGGPQDVQQAILNTARADGYETRIVLPEDPGQAGKAQSAYLTGLLVGYHVQCIRETGDKATRATPFASQVNVGNVCLVKSAWNAPFIEELRAFPAATHDDQVDAAAGAFTAIWTPNMGPLAPDDADSFWADDEGGYEAF
ncbi:MULTISPECIES: phage terminase large subunit [unclassified Saccharibacter]|uniref:phage terminase large subunit n=1 Tax=unclassified Saccharibacter TaxID=2648722 RepID=UPI001322DAAD|nr:MULTISPECIES: phage terminase large subunit [unclassified Saccharibacter]MXV35688.1 phage terminase large subunit [Saccharibacter sp. EH611]MXV58302.1 phage terminase large subunit [Saccharibacter sp. EH70]MXV66401.1 phage terminase large subunit [Saccharibacter sp. EH60]